MPVPASEIPCLGLEDYLFRILREKSVRVERLKAFDCGLDDSALTRGLRFSMFRLAFVLMVHFGTRPVQLAVEPQVSHRCFG